ncbi:MAG: histidinol-phosphatase [Acidiferrobacter sp.]
MALALFDLDNTLLDGDSDYAWGQFLIAAGAVDRESHEQTNLAFYEDYKQGALDIQAFLVFALEPLTRYPRAQLLAWRATFIQDYIRPIVKPWVPTLLERYRAAGDTLVLVTATNSFVTAPIADLLGIPHLVATIPEEHNGHFTGRPQGTPCFREGKVSRMQSWMTEHTLAWENSCFYSDSHNDLPLLEAVTYPVAVDPDPILLTTARLRGWEILTTPARKLAENAK